MYRHGYVFVIKSRQIMRKFMTAAYLGAALIASAATLTMSPVAYAHDDNGVRNGGVGNPNNNGVRNGGVGNGNGVGNRVHGAPGPVAGAGLIPLALGCGVYLIYRRRRRNRAA
jgi:hypothetical protein